MKDELKERRKELAEMKHRMTNRSQITAESVNIGKIVEKIAPSFSGFQFEPHDCRSLLEPIDYIIFTGLHERAVIESVTFLDVKSGGARLTPMQKAISSLIEQGRIEVETIVRDKEAQNGK
ncbi:Holliday junction resolvase-like protein, partial [Umezakia ovalisporum]|uniref:Holliday junction resolvase-like protein n=1 Tax=Umezakia ovalisporum TaxID=75695 RepID=UPI0039C5BB66